MRQRLLVIDDSVNALALAGRFIFIATPDRLERVRLGSARAPRTIATGVNINSVAVGGKYVFWGDDGLPIRNQPWHGAIHRADFDGSHARKLRIPGLQQPACLALVGPFLFWGDFEANRIGRARLDGSEAANVIETAGSPVGLASNGEALYWAANVGGEATGLEAIGKANLDATFSPMDVNQSLLSLEPLDEDPYSLALG